MSRIQICLVIAVLLILYLWTKKRNMDVKATLLKAADNTVDYVNKNVVHNDDIKNIVNVDLPL